KVGVGGQCESGSRACRARTVEWSAARRRVSTAASHAPLPARRPLKLRSRCVTLRGMEPGDALPAAREAGPTGDEPRSLDRALGAWAGASLTTGAVIGTGIFLTAGDVARSLPHPTLVLAAWISGGLLVLAGALAYAEMGAMFPRAGGLYHFLREAWGPL